MKKQRNQVLNVMEALASFLVVMIHFPFPGRFGTMVLSLARVSVPLFYAVSGYFLYKGDPVKERNGIIKKIARLTGLVLLAEVCTFLFYVALQFEDVGIIHQAVRNVIDLEFWGVYLTYLSSRLLVLAPVFCGISWFMTSLIAVYLIYYTALKFAFTKKIAICAPVFLLVGILFRRVAVAMNWMLPESYERFVLFLPLPFFTLGYEMSRWKEAITKVDRKYYSVMMILGIVITICEHFDNGTHTLYFGTCVIVFSCIGLATVCSKLTSANPIINMLDYIGGNCTTTIYLMHMIVGTSIKLIIPKILPISNDNILLSWCFPLLVCIATTILSAVLSVVMKLRTVRYAGGNTNK